MAQREGKFLRMIQYGKTYRPAVDAAKAAVEAGDDPRQVVEELAFVVAALCDAHDLELNVAKDVIDTVAKVQHSARMYASPGGAEA